MTPTCKWYVERFIAAFESGNDSLVKEIHSELNESQALYIEVFGFLPSTMRRQIKEILNRD